MTTNRKSFHNTIIVPCSVVQVESGTRDEVPTMTAVSLIPNRDELQKVCMWLLEHGCAPLPVAPRQDAGQYPARDKKGQILYEKDGITPKGAYTGKNPSYLDVNGKPHIVAHAKYCKRLPTKSEIERWWANPANGIGTLGSGSIIWIDFDAKNYASQEEFDKAFQAFLDDNPELLSTAYLETTHSGGKRVGVKVEKPKTFTNFALSPEGQHVGEALGSGRFTVLAPTIGVSGNPYININRTTEFTVVGSLEALGLHPVKKEKTQKTVSIGGEKMATSTPTTPAASPLVTGELRLEHSSEGEENVFFSTGEVLGECVKLTALISKNAKRVLAGNSLSEDRSKDLTVLINEVCGWRNWCDRNGVPFEGDYHELGQDAGIALGIDLERVDRIFKSIDTNSAIPAAEYAGGDVACWKIVRKLSRTIYEMKCPMSLREQIDAIFRQFEPAQKVLVTTTPEETILTALFEDGRGNYTVINDGFYLYQEEQGYWKYITDKAVERSIAHKLRTLYRQKKDGDDYQEVYNFATDRNKVSSFKFCRSALPLEQEPPYNDHLLAFLNGTVDLRTGELQPHDKDNLLTSVIASDYTRNAECPQAFRDFICNSFGEEFLPLIRELTAMYLDPSAPYGKFAHIIGSSGSGKGTLIRFWQSMFGKENCRTLNSFNDLNTAEGRHQFLTGARFISLPDLGGWQGGIRAFYELVDNGNMSGRALFSSSGYDRKWNCRFALASVDLLALENSGDGWYRRAVPVPTKERQGKINPNLGWELEQVKGEVISWALGLPWEERYKLLEDPSACNEKIKSIQNEQSKYSDSVRAFIDMALRPTSDSNATVQNHHMHDWYVAFCKTHGFSPSSYTKFISHLKNVLPNNFVRRDQQRDKGKRINISAHFNHLEIVPGSFVQQQHMGNTIWDCQKHYCTEGGLDAFDKHWAIPVTASQGGSEVLCDTPVTDESFTQQDLFAVSQPSQPSQGTFYLSKKIEKQLETIAPPPTCGDVKDGEENQAPKQKKVEGDGEMGTTHPDASTTALPPATFNNGDKNNSINSPHPPCDGCDSSSNPVTVGVTGQFAQPCDMPVTPCDGQGFDPSHDPSRPVTTHHTPTISPSPNAKPVVNATPQPPMPSFALGDEASFFCEIVKRDCPVKLTKFDNGFWDCELLEANEIYRQGEVVSKLASKLSYRNPLL